MMFLAPTRSIPEYWQMELGKPVARVLLGDEDAMIAVH